MEEIPDLEADLDGVEAVHRCPYCDRPFRAERPRDLHLGEVHADRLDDAECEAHEAAVEAEDDELFLFHMKVVVALGVLYTVSVLSYTALVGLTG